MVVFILALLSSILVADFPKIRRQFALTRAVHKMSQDLRRAQDMGFSGQKVEVDGTKAKSFGVYINLDSPTLGNKKYIIYADIDGNQQYNESNADLVMETVDFGQTEPGVIIDRIENMENNNRWVDINFEPPSPTVKIRELESDKDRVKIIFTLESDPSKERTVSAYISGLIEIK
ncbi:MAG: hypothetical protein HYT35_01400 [Candidatus Staskawiczbacteria bacterium]|nr:hypothetical protein [Candidatus Staskawiczbacteria bacterium]